MPAKRFLGAAWASAHGPNDPTRLARWVCEGRFAGIVPAPALRSIDWGDVAAAARDYPFALPAVRVSSILSEKPTTAGLASNRESDQKLARQAVQQAVGLAVRLATRLVILEPGIVPLLGEVDAEDLGDPSIVWTQDRAHALLARRKAGLDAALDAACRGLFALCRANPEMTFCLTPGRSLRALADPAALTAVFEDLRGCKIAYWHDTAVVARREQVFGEAQGAWLEAFSSQCAGCTLGDARPEGMYLPPGSGGVDYPLLTSYLRPAGKAVSLCLELEPAVAGAELPGVRACLDKFGL